MQKTRGWNHSHRIVPEATSHRYIYTGVGNQLTGCFGPSTETVYNPWHFRTKLFVHRYDFRNSSYGMDYKRLPDLIGNARLRFENRQLHLEARAAHAVESPLPYRHHSRIGRSFAQRSDKFGSGIGRIPWMDTYRVHKTRGSRSFNRRQVYDGPQGIRSVSVPIVDGNE